MLFVDHSWQQI